MITKELLSEVLNLKSYLLQSNPIFEENIWVGYIYGAILDVKNTNDVYRQHKRINIYELAHKCKEWALINHNATISSSIYSTYSKCWDIQNDKSYVADTEAEAIFKACQWILDKKGE